MKIKRNVDKSTFYREVLELLRSFPPLNKLRPKEVDLLCEIMRQNDYYRNLDKQIRKTIIFSTDNRKDLCDKLGCSSDALNNNLSILRKHKLLSAKNDLLSILDIDADKGFNFELDIATNG